MIISRTPFRVSLFGGGTDYPAWYREHGGQVLGTAINKYCWITCRYLPPFFEHRFRVVYSKIEDRSNVEDIAHPAAREVLRYLKVEHGVEIHHDGDLPARSGIGSSSSFAVGLLHAIHALRGEMSSKTDLAAQAIHVEQELLKEAVGCQDQVFAAHGGFNHLEFLGNGEIVVTPLTVRAERTAELNAHLMLFFTGVSRTASSVARSYSEDLHAKARQLKRMHAMVDDAIGVIRGAGDIAHIGELLDEGWQLKRSLDPSITTSDVDALYTAARAAGALGGKLLGAGGGGFVLLFVKPSDQARVKQALAKLIHVPFRFDYSGSRIVFFDVEEDFSEQSKLRALHQIAPFRDGDIPPGAAL
jgi:D-glycero-alpha-D-manno-heptose-7-phosphate kinase